MRTILIQILLFTLAAHAVEGIVIRHDRDDGAYRKLAEGYPMVCRIGAGMGTLVEPEWVLTAAHVAEQVVAGGEVRCGDRTVEVDKAFLHPDYAVEGRHRDLALIRLAEPVRGIPTARLYGEGDELGQTVVLVGDGRTGTGLTGPVEGERLRRGARNVVEAVRPGWIELVFDAPPGGDDLEGISGPGDSGGPALLERDGVRSVIGVSAYNDGGELCTYGTIEHYARVSDERAWIDGVISGRITRSSERRLLRHEVAPDGQETVRSEEIRDVDAPAAVVRSTERVARALIDAINANDPSAFRALFGDAYLRREGGGVDSMLEFMAGARAVRGDIVSLHPVTAHALRIEDTESPMLPVIWHLADGTSGYFGIALDPAGRIAHLSLFVREDICRGGSSCPVAIPLE